MHLATGAGLSGFTLTNGAAGDGGGAYQRTLFNCTLTGNSATTGGWASYSTLCNCIVYFSLSLGDCWDCALNRCFTAEPRFVNAVR